MSGLFSPPAVEAPVYTITSDTIGASEVQLVCANEETALEWTRTSPRQQQATVRFGAGPCAWQVDTEGVWTLASSDVPAPSAHTRN